MTIDRDIISNVRDLDKVELVGTVRGRKVWRKETIYPGEFSQPGPNGTRIKFKVSEDDLRHWANQSAIIAAKGIDTPLYLGHTENPELRRGDVVGLEVAYNPKKKRNSLYSLIEFAKPEWEDLALTSNVSMYAPKSFTDGKGETHPSTIRHIALTDYPVIPDLDKFETIVASLDAPTPTKQEPVTMPMNTLAEALGVELEEGADDAAMEAAIVEHVSTLTERIAELEAQIAELKGEGEGAGEGNGEGGNAPESIAASLVGAVRDARETKISRLVEQGKATPKQAKDLKAKYATDTAIRLSLSGKADAFDDSVALLEQNEKQVDRNRTTLRLGNGGNGTGGGSDRNPLLEDAKRRAEAKKPTRR